MLNSDLTYNCEYAPEGRVDSCHHKCHQSFSAASSGKQKSEEPKAIRSISSHEQVGSKWCSKGGVCECQCVSPSYHVSSPVFSEDV